MYCCGPLEVEPIEVTWKQSSDNSSEINTAVKSLMNLGYDKGDATARVMALDDTSLPASELFKHVLQNHEVIQ